MQPLIAAIRHHSKSRPEATAVRWRGKEHSYQQLAGMLLDRARILEQEGLRPGDVVALEAVRGLDSIVDTGALWLLGCVPVPFPRDSAPELVADIQDRAGGYWMLRPGCPPSPGLPPQRASLAKGNTTLVLPTSGSTGVPKLVPLSAESLSAFVCWADRTFGLSRRTVIGFAPLNFDLSLMEIWATLSAGGTVELISDDEALNPAALRSHLRKSTADFFQAVPFVFQTLATSNDELDLVLERMRDIVVTGSATDAKTRTLLATTFPNATFHNIYGSTETNNSFMFTIDVSQLLQLPDLPIGVPLPGVQASILDQDGRSLTGAARGELHVRTPFMMNGYVGSPSIGDALFPTGDIVTRDQNGQYSIESRNSRIVKIRGNRINLDQVEAVISSHSSVEETVVISRTGHDTNSRIEALVRLRDEQQCTALTLRMHCSRHLPPYAIPASISLVSDPFPRTSTHKIDRNASERHHYESAAINA
mgnify:CR=1 FL=1